MAAVPPKNPALTQDRTKVVMATPAMPTGTGSAMPGARAAGWAGPAGAVRFSETPLADIGCSLRVAAVEIYRSTI